PPDKALPASHHLQLVEAPGDCLPPAQRGKAAVVLLNEQVQVLRPQFCQPLIFEVDVREAHTLYPTFVPLAPQLMQKGGLARPAHANHGCGLAGEAHSSVDAPWCGGWKRYGQRIGEVLGKQRAQWLGGIISHASYFLLFKGRKSRFFILTARRKSRAAPPTTDPKGGWWHRYPSTSGSPHSFRVR